MKGPTNRGSKKAKGVRDLAVKQSAGAVKGGEVSGRHYPEVTIDVGGSGPHTVGEAAFVSAVMAGAGGAVPK